MALTAVPVLQSVGSAIASLFLAVAELWNVVPVEMVRGRVGYIGVTQKEI
jgi:hypothetical protein